MCQPAYRELFGYGTQIEGATELTPFVNGTITDVTLYGIRLMADKESAIIKGALGFILAELGQYDRVELLTQSYDVDREKSQGGKLYFLAIAYHRRGDTDKSIAVFREAESLHRADPFHERARFVIASH